MVPLKPDLVLVGSVGPPADAAAAARAWLPRGRRRRSSTTSPPARAQIREIAALLGHPERGEALIAEIDAARRRLAAAPRPASSTALLVGNGGYTVGPAEPRRRADERGRA